MGYIKMTLANGAIHTINADGVRHVASHASNADEIDIFYSATSSDKIVVTLTTASERDDVKASIRAALLAYQRNQEGPAVESNGGKSISGIALT